MVLMMVCIGSSRSCGGGGGGDAVAGNQVVIVVGRMPGFTERRYLFYLFKHYWNVPFSVLYRLLRAKKNSSDLHI